MKATDTRMTEGSIPKQMIGFAAPLLVGNLFQQLYNTADALIVGRMLGNDALAAVSSTGSLVFMIVSFFVGISAGAGVCISRYYGARDRERLEKAIHTNVVLNIIATVLLTLAGTLLTPAILRWMDTPEDIFAGSLTYVRIYFAGSIGLVFYNSFRGIMQAVGDSKNPLKYLILSSVVNVILDIAFIALFHGGVGSAALATVISQFISAVLCLVQLMRTPEEYRISLRKLGLDSRIAGEILRYGIPSGLQNSVIAIANVVVQSNINGFGKMAVAGLGAYSKLEGFAFLPVNAFTIALTTFVGQNLGAASYERARKGARVGLIWCVAMAELIGALLFLLARPLIGAFTDEAEAVAFGVEKCREVAPFFCFLAATHGLSAVLRGAGKAMVPMVTTLAIWCVGRVSFLEILVPIYRDIAVVNWVYPLTWFLSTAVLIFYYYRADWVHGFEKNSK